MNKLVCRCVYLLAGEISVHTVNGSDPLLSQDALHQKIHAFKILKCLIIMEQFLCHTNKQANKNTLLTFRISSRTISNDFLSMFAPGLFCCLFVTKFTVQRNCLNYILLNLDIFHRIKTLEGVKINVADFNS